MTKAPNPRDPQSQPEKTDIEKAAEQAMDAVKKQAASRALPNFTADELIMNNPKAEVVKGNQYRASVTLHAPAMLEVMSHAYRSLLKLNKERGKGTIKTLEKVRAALLQKGGTFVFIWPTHKDDPEGIPVNYHRSSVFINLITLLWPQDLAIETGYRERYEVSTVGKESATGPALVFDLELPVERRRQSDGKDVTDQPPSDQAPSGEI